MQDNPFEAIAANPAKTAQVWQPKKRWLPRWIRYGFLFALLVFVVGGIVAYLTKAQMFRNPDDWDKLTFINAEKGKCVLFYTGRADEPTAQRLAQALSQDPFFGNSPRVDIVLDLQDGWHVVSFFQRIEKLDRDFNRECEQLRLRIEKYLPDKPVKLQICEPEVSIDYGKPALKPWLRFPVSERGRND